MDVTLFKQLPTLTETIRQYDLLPKKSLGQNFLTDLNITRKIAMLAGNLNKCPVIEIGPGPGALTRGLLLQGATQIIAIEKDSRSLQVLKPLIEASAGDLTVLNQDALICNWKTLCEVPYKIVANLPYNISAILLIQWLENCESIQQMTLMFQKEVADRIVAKPGSKTYGRLSILVQSCFQPVLEMVLPPHVFYPPPKVHSAVVNFYKHHHPFDKDLWENLKIVTQHAFAQRRKMIKNQLKALSHTPEKWLELLDINPQARAEELSLDNYCALAKTMTV